MSNELATTKTAIDRLNNSLAKSSLDDLVRARTRRSLLLVDRSSSMGNYISAGGRRIDALRKVVADLLETHPVPVAAFGSDVQLVDRVPEPKGGTAMAEAIRFGTREGANHLVIVTDGEPRSESDTFEAARAFGGPIDTIYIGDGRDHGSRFCAELARMTGGTAQLTDLGEPKKLATSIRALIGDGR